MCIVEIHLRLLEMIHELLLGDSYATKRDLYYRDVNLFTHQRVVDLAVDDLSYHFGVDRFKLHVVGYEIDHYCCNIILVGFL